MEYSLGLDIGSVGTKLSLVGPDGRCHYRDHIKSISSPRDSVNLLLSRLERSFPLERITGAAFSCADKTVIPAYLGWEHYSGSLASAAGILHENPTARTIIQAGGQMCLIVELEDGLTKPWKVYSNPLCAAGTGRFIEQQAYRLGINLDELAELALAYHQPAPRIASRCSVFAKSDLIHLQQKGVGLDAMLSSLCESIARMITSLKKGAFIEPLYFVGGLAANRAIQKALVSALAARNGTAPDLHVPDYSLFTQCLGLARLGRELKSEVKYLPIDGSRPVYYQLPPLEKSVSENSSSRLSLAPGQCYLGIDIGSTSTKAVLMDEQGNLVAKDYLMTAGRPVDAVKKVFADMLSKGAGGVHIAGAGVTGSGRYLIGSLIGADLVKNEITAQTRAAMEIDPDADIIEIGGQDSKLVVKRNGVVVDYQMNKACAAGTGSFIDELAEMLGVSVTDGQFARLAFNAPYTIDLGTRCAAFMGQSVSSAQQSGISLEVITASLANSIASNYLSKVVGTRKLGNKIILTGAVFYNQAVVAAFKQQLPQKDITVAPNCEVTGAIGAALLAKESIGPNPSNFKGLTPVIESDCVLSSFLCSGCENNCTITRMHSPDGQQVFFGSRCDKYDARSGHKKAETLFDERYRLLMPTVHTDNPLPTIGVPQSLLVYDYAPLLSGFINALGARARFSGITSQSIMERSVELSYSDSCFPVKLLHGHIEALSDVDFILYPSFIRLGPKEEDKNQKYSCPLAQASPFIARQILDAGNRLVCPIIDFSRGHSECIESLAGAAVQMGYGLRQGRRAAQAGLAAQERFRQRLKALGHKTIRQLEGENKLGVVIIARSYMSQDSGANLGIAEKLAQLGVVPVPLDLLDLEQIDPSRYSDRPYWSYESSFIAATSLVVGHSQLYGLVITNFGCGPDSFILKLLEDISASKPLGQLEIDEHAAETGLVTRLEAFVDTIRQHASYTEKAPEVNIGGIYRGTSSRIEADKKLLIPRMSPHADVLAAAMQAHGVDARVLPETEYTDLMCAAECTSGAECLPFRVTLGGFLRFFRENPGANGVQGFMSGSYGPCRLGKYAIEQERLLKKAGYDMPLCTTVSNNAYRDLNLGPGFERTAWKAIVAVDYLQRLLWHSRPYCRDKKEADDLFDEYLNLVANHLRRRENYGHLLRQANRRFPRLADPLLPPRPLVGINGEIFLRANRFSNDNLVETCEEAGLEVIVSPMSEWLNYTTYRNLEDAMRDGHLGRIISSWLKKYIQKKDEEAVAGLFEEVLDGKDSDTWQVLAASRQFLSPRCGSEAVLSIGSGIHWMQNPGFSGVISIMPHGCMPGGIVAAMAEKFSTAYGKPWISLTYDGFLESNNRSKVSNFAEILRFCRSSKP